MRYFLLASLFLTAPAFAQDCTWSSELDGSIPAVDTSGSFNTLTCAGNLTITGNFNFNNVPGIDDTKPALLDVGGNLTLNAGVVLSLNGGNGGVGNNGAGNISGGVATLSGGGGGGNFGTAEPGIGLPRSLPTEGGGEAGLDDNAAASGGGGGNFLDTSGSSGASSAVTGGAEGSVVTSSNFNFTTLFFGGNGGGAGGIGNTNADYGGGGGAGAGALKISLTGSLNLLAGAKITAIGGNGGAGFGMGAGGGGGSGGAIYIVSSNNITLNSAAGTEIRATGGSAGAGGASGVAGGAGGNGVIRIEYSGEIIGSGQISPTPTLVDSNPISTTQQLEKFSSDISCGVVGRVNDNNSFWQILLGFGMAMILFKRKKSSNL